MSYQRGFLDKRVKLWNPVRVDSAYGGGKVEYQEAKTVWANASFVKGQRALRNGEVDVYQTVMFRMDCHSVLTRRTRLECDGTYYVIDSFNKDLGKNECQITAYEIDDLNKVVVSG